MQARSISFHPASLSLRVRCRTTPEQDRMVYLAGRRAVEAHMATQWKAHVRDLYRPITLPDGSFWRCGLWNTPPTAYRSVAPNEDKPHRCPECHTIPIEVRDEDGRAIPGKAYQCTQCRVRWIAPK